MTRRIHDVRRPSPRNPGRAPTTTFSTLFVVFSIGSGFRPPFAHAVRTSPRRRRRTEYVSPAGCLRGTQGQDPTRSTFRRFSCAFSTDLRFFSFPRARKLAPGYRTATRHIDSSERTLLRVPRRDPTKSRFGRFRRFHRLSRPTFRLFDFSTSRALETRTHASRPQTSGMDGGEKTPPRHLGRHPMRSTGRLFYCSSRQEGLGADLGLERTRHRLTRAGVGELSWQGQSA